MSGKFSRFPFKLTTLSSSSGQDYRGPFDSALRMTPVCLRAGILPRPLDIFYVAHRDDDLLFVQDRIVRWIYQQI